MLLDQISTLMRLVLRTIAEYFMREARPVRVALTLKITLLALYRWLLHWLRLGRIHYIKFAIQKAIGCWAVKFALIISQWRDCLALMTQQFRFLTLWQLREWQIRSILAMWGSVFVTLTGALMQIKLNWFGKTEVATGYRTLMILWTQKRKIQRLSTTTCLHSFRVGHGSTKYALKGETLPSIVRWPLLWWQIVSLPQSPVSHQLCICLKIWRHRNSTSVQ